MAEIDGELEAVFGGPSDHGFGSAVFRRPMPATGDLEELARGVYRDFVGELWDRFGADAWLGPWAELAQRARASDGAILAILDALADPLVRSAGDVLVNGGTDPDAARAALTRAFDIPVVSDLRVYATGDGGAMSGLLIAARNDTAAEAVFLVFLMD